MMRQVGYQTLRLYRFFIKREALKSFIWIISLVGLTISVAIAFSGMYQSDAERQLMAETMENPALIALVGQGYGLDNYHTGAMMAHQMLLFTGIAVAIMSILLVVRLTRADEEEGRLEMIRSLPVGRLAPTNTTMLVLITVNLILGVTTSISLGMLGIDSIDWNGSLLYGALLCVTGIIFGAITLLAAQLSNNARGTMMLSFLIVGASYIVRAIGDVSYPALSWLSPLGILLGSEVYVNNFWWPILIIAVLTLVIVGIALYLQQIRDLDAGLLPDRAGKDGASAFLKKPVGFALRLLWTSLIAWFVTVVLIGVTYGSVIGDLENFLGENELVAQIIGGVSGLSLTEQFLTMIVAVMAIFATVPTLMAFIKIKGEENSGRLEPLLARNLSRSHLLGTYLSIGFITSVVMNLASIVSLAGIGMMVVDEPLNFQGLVEQQLAYLPAIWLLLGLMCALYGWAPKYTSFSWYYLFFIFFVLYFGNLVGLPDWLFKLSPFEHVPVLATDEVSWTSMLSLMLIAILLAELGFIGFKRRDIQ